MEGPAEVSEVVQLGGPAVHHEELRGHQLARQHLVSTHRETQQRPDLGEESVMRSSQKYFYAP